MAQLLAALIPEPKLTLTLATDADLDVRSFTVNEAVSGLFTIRLRFMSSRPDIDFDAVIGRPAAFRVTRGATIGEPRLWTGVASNIEQVDIEDTVKGLSSYEVVLVPQLWLLTQRRNYRMFQQMSEPKIVLKLLGDWGIEPELEIDLGAYKDRKYRVQYGESDYAFLCRMLEDAGIAFYFKQVDGETKLVLSDRLHTKQPVSRLPYVNRSTNRTPADFATDVKLTRQVRPGTYTQRDHDYRRPPSFPLMATAQSDDDIERLLERYHYTPGSFLYRADSGDSTPVADDKGKARTDLDEGAAQVQKRLEAKRAAARLVVFRTTVIDLKPGDVATVDGYPRPDLENKNLLVVATSFTGDWKGDWVHVCETRFTDMPYRPPLVTPKPRVQGVESATVVGPKGEEIHTDEFGRVRVQFHWDREGRRDETSSCWIHVSQAWGGAGYGATNLPRVGQEVIVDFLGGDPDRPVVTGRVFTNLQKTPYTLPEHKTRSGWKSNSSPSYGGYNEIMFEDKAGSELVHMRAQRNMTTQVNHDQLSSIGNNRSTSISKNESKSVGGSQNVSVQGDNSSMTGADFLQSVLGMFTSLASADRVLQTNGSSSSQAHAHSITSDQGTTLTVGNSMIHIGPDSIVIQTPKLLLNPGESVAASSALGGALKIPS